MKKKTFLLLLSLPILNSCTVTTSAVVPVAAVPSMVNSRNSTYFIYDAAAIDLNRDNKINRDDYDLAQATLEKLSSLRLNNDAQQQHLKESAVYDLMRQVLVGNGPIMNSMEAEQLRLRLSIIGRIAMVKEAADKLPGKEIIPDEPSRLDFSIYEQLGVKPYFVTDLDSTAWDGDLSTYFMGYILEKGKLNIDNNEPIINVMAKTLSKVDNREELVKLPPLDLLLWAYKTHLAGGPVDGLTLFNLVCLATSGFTRDELKAMVVDFFDNGYEEKGDGRPFKERIYGEQVSLYAYLQAKGAPGYAISAGLDFLAQEGASRMGLAREKVHSSQLAYDENGRSLGFCQRNIFSIKDEEVLAIADDLKGLPMAAYGDSIHSDTPMFLWADVVNRIIDGPGYHQLALAPEFKGRRPDDIKTPKVVEELNKEFGTNFEFHNQPTFTPMQVIP